jgi:hypothetical protein
MQSTATPLRKQGTIYIFFHVCRSIAAQCKLLQ